MSVDVIILAGGLGTRLRSVIPDTPKPMAPVAGKPFLDRILDHLDLEMVDRIVLSVGYRHEQIQNYFGMEYHGKDILYAVEHEPLGTGGGIKLALSKCHSEQVLILNGDTYVDVDIASMLSYHVSTGSQLTIASKHIEHPKRYGCIEMDFAGRIESFSEKDEFRQEGHINAGVYIIDRKLQEQMPQKDRFSFETDFLEARVDDLKFYAYLTDGLFIDIGIPEDYERAQGLF